jgi:hypothetical protein
MNAMKVSSFMGSAPRPPCSFAANRVLERGATFLAGLVDQMLVRVATAAALDETESGFGILLVSSKASRSIS